MTIKAPQTKPDGPKPKPNPVMEEVRSYTRDQFNYVIGRAYGSGKTAEMERERMAYESFGGWSADEMHAALVKAQDEHPPAPPLSRSAVSARGRKFALGTRCSPREPHVLLALPLALHCTGCGRSWR